ncbi:hypothetical protein BH24ACT3_BH24ACT3_11200 [soil metagenome]
MTVLDAYAVLALLKDERAADEVKALLDRRDASVTAVGAAEVVDHLVRIVGADEEQAVLDVAQLGLIPGIDVDTALAIDAGRLRARHYDRRERAVSLADCVAAAAARVSRSALATSDPHLLDLCRDEGIRVRPLPDARGATWTPGAPPAP